VLFFLSLAGAFTACGDKGTELKKDGFDRKALLSNVGNNIIMPNYSAFNTAAAQLHAAAGQFTASPDASSLGTLQNQLKEAYRAYQSVALFELGPAEQELLRANLNTFPTDVNQINANIGAGTYDLGTASNLDAKGFPALDYLLFGLGTDAPALVGQYTTDANAAKRKKYLTDLTMEIKTKAEKVNTAWSVTGGNYLNTFVNADGTDAGSSLGLLVNQLNWEYELLKNAKLGIPLGKKTLGTPLPESVEAYYSGMSSELARLGLQNIENVYFGIHRSGNNGIGLDDYLVSLNARRGETTLAEAIADQLRVVKNKLAALNDPLAGAIRTNPAPVNEAYAEIQKGVVLLKSDLPSQLGVLITYQDNDGD
jgi:predicted lipoprotein